jgi:hypothetical protein
MRHIHYLHSPVSDLTVYQREVYNAGMKLYYILPLKIRSSSTASKQFKVALKEFLLAHTFCSVDFKLLQNSTKFNFLSTSSALLQNRNSHIFMFMRKKEGKETELQILLVF